MVDNLAVFLFGTELPDDVRDRRVDPGQSRSVQ